ncbi:ubiquitin-like-specific protease ESD4 isoform X2 [Vigna angularis]|uniref:ubiquitin-like-specific protease ESD4 isoform X2 n=1 Tax=Phaseolus angularis TaxID=3914 RepID=UPI0022B448ED|nr:ubiquitin-like-specific protease ESD4 isoform X2 [Vigna angularis]
MVEALLLDVWGYSDMDKDVSEMASLRVRHRVQTQHIVQVNGCLSSFQKERLKSTPFKWLVDLVDDMLFVPTVSDDHWWCYCVNCQSREFFILDSLGHKRRTRYGIDKAMVGCLQELFNMIDNEANCEERQLKVIKEDLPIQPNTYDCGLLVMKYMELWDNQPKFDGKKMPDYTTEQLQLIRQQTVCDWVLHEGNMHRSTVMKNCGML